LVNQAPPFQLSTWLILPYPKSSSISGPKNLKSKALNSLQAFLVYTQMLQAENGLC
jgi:hypothetical protein